MNIKRFIMVAVATISTTPALAQDAPSGGLYAGALVGYDHVTISDGTDSGNKDGVTYGAILGYDFDLGSAVAGIEAELNDSSVSITQTDLLVTGDVGTLSAGRDLYVGVRVGFKASENVIVYAKGGYTNARVKLDYNDNDGFTFNEGDNLDGFRIGGGVEYSFGKLAVRGEYRYSDYGNYTYEGIDSGLGVGRHQVVATLLGKF